MDQEKTGMGYLAAACRAASAAKDAALCSAVCAALRGHQSLVGPAQAFYPKKAFTISYSSQSTCCTVTQHAQPCCTQTCVGVVKDILRSAMAAVLTVLHDSTDEQQLVEC